MGDEMTLLKDTSLCAIVRDEKMNPAGGVERFLRCHLPYVEEAVVVDTGSSDGTRGILDKLTSEFSHLRVYDSLFGGYSMVRNRSLREVKTKWALVLDADELLEPVSFESIAEDLTAFSDADGFAFALSNVCGSSIGVPDYNVVNNPRLFNRGKGFRYFPEGKFAEYLYDMQRDHKISEIGNVRLIPPSAPLLHFRPTSEGTALKTTHWYDQIGRLDVTSFGPAQVRGFSEWKLFNPERNKYSG
jgi:glycosyltransferase involved in cell wall biosynthesis